MTLSVDNGFLHMKTKEQAITEKNKLDQIKKKKTTKTFVPQTIPSKM